MTRINCLPVETLASDHLVAEYRELPRVFQLAYKAYLRGVDPSTYPTEYTLGPGHVTFFYTRLLYLKRRFHALVAEMRARGYLPNYTKVPEVYNLMPKSWRRDWTPDKRAMTVNLSRIQTRRLQASFRSML